MAYTIDNLSKYLVEQGSTQTNADKTIKAIDTILNSAYANEIIYVDFDWVSKGAPTFTLVIKNNTPHDMEIVKLASELSYNSSPHTISDNPFYDSAFDFSVLPESFFDDEEEPHGFAIWKA